MAALEASLSAFSLSTSCSSIPLPSHKPQKLLLTRPSISNSTPLLLSRNSSTISLLCNNHPASRKLCFKLCSTVQEISADTKADESQEASQKRRLYVANLPWSLSVADLKNLFAQCGTVSDIELVKQKNGSSRGFAFVTMASEQEGQAAVEKLDSHEVSGRIIRVEFARALSKKPPPPAPVEGETRHKLYVSNLAWKARSTHLREFFSTNFKPVSSRVIFENASGRSAGYGFVSFATREEADAAVSALDGKELMGRPVRLKISERKAAESGLETPEEANSPSESENAEEGQPQE